MKTLQVTAICALFLVGLLTAVAAQDLPIEERGLKPFGSYQGGNLDSINMGNGSLTLHIPFWSYPQRGATLRVGYFISFTSNPWRLTDFCGPNACHARWQWLGPCGGPACQIGGIGIKTDRGISVQSETIQLLYGQYTSYTVVQPSGAITQLAETDSTLGDYRSFDGTGILYRLSGGLWNRDGTYSTGNVTDWVKHDPNGNSFHWSPPTIFSVLPEITDSLGRNIPREATADPNDLAQCDNTPLPTTSATVWNVPAPNDGVTATAKVILCKVTIHVHKDPYDEGNGDLAFDADKPFIQSIILPNGTKWKFEYQANEGNITKITLPTGGSISYTWGQFPDSCTDPGFTQRVTTRTVDAGDGSPPRTWTYSWNFEQRVTDPQGNDTDYTFVNCGYESERRVYQGPKNGGTLLKTVQTQYETFPGGFDSQRPACFPTTVTTIWPNGASTVQSKMVKDWDGPGSVGQFHWHGPERSGAGSYGNLFDVKEYDNGNGAPSSTVLRETVNSYVFTGNSSYKTNNLLDLLSSVQVKNGSSQQMALTTYGYDEYSTYPLQPSGVTTQFDPNPPNGSIRGNQTSVNRWLNTGGYLSSHNTFYDTGMVRYADDPAGHRTTYTYDGGFAGAYPTQVQLPDTHSPNQASHISYTNYDFNSGTVLSTTDENSRVTSYLYDLLSRPRKIDYPDGGQALFAFNDALPSADSPSVTLTSKVTSGLNNIKTFIVDGLGRLTHVQHISDPEGTVYVDTTYDELGRKATVTNPYRSPTGESTNGTTQYQYDALGRSTTETRPDGTQVITSYLANCTTVTDEAGKARKSCSDGLGRLIQVIEDPGTSPHLNYETDYQYDALGNLTCVEQHGTATGQSGCSGSNDVGSLWRIRRFTYDSVSRLLTAKNPELGNTTSYGTITYTYDLDGNVLTRQAPAPNQAGSNTVTTTYGYDEIHRLLSKSYSDGSTPTVRYGYDGGVWSNCVIPPPSSSDPNPKPARTSICDGSGATAWTHDTMGRPWQEQRTLVGTTNVTKIFNYTYNPDGSLATLQYPSGRTITYSLEYAGSNTSGRLVSARDAANGIDYVTNATYAPQGAIAGYTNHANIQARLTYDPRLQPLQIFYGTNASIPDLKTSACPAPGSQGNIMHRVYHFGVGVNDNGNVQAVDNCNDSNKTQNFDYDALNRIAHAWTSGSNWGETYTIDPWGNLTNIDAYAGKTYHENLAAAPASWKNQLNISGQVIDAAGNLTNDGLGHTYTYDAENRLIATAGWTYVYDADGRRVKKCNACSSASGGTLYWTGAGSDALAESNLGGTLTYEYIFFNGKRVARRDNTSNPPAYYFADHLGSATVIAGSGGSIKNTYEYFPYGGLVSSSETLPQNYKFTGKERDAESNLDEFGARYYASALGRFMIPDWAAKPTSVPYANFGNPQSLNLYSYVQNNPTTVGDPDGHCGDIRGGECNGSVGSSTGAGQGHNNEADNSSSRGKAQNQNQSQQSQQQQNTGTPPNSRQDVVLIPAGGGKPVPNTPESWRMDWRPMDLVDGHLQSPGSKYAKADISLSESVNGGPFKSGGHDKGAFTDMISTESRTIIQRFSIDTKRLQVVLGTDSKGNLIKTWDVKLTIKQNEVPTYSPVP